MQKWAGRGGRSDWPNCILSSIVLTILGVFYAATGFIVVPFFAYISAHFMQHLTRVFAFYFKRSLSTFVDFATS